MRNLRDRAVPGGAARSVNFGTPLAAIVAGVPTPPTLRMPNPEGTARRQTTGRRRRLGDNSAERFGLSAASIVISALSLLKLFITKSAPLDRAPTSNHLGAGLKD